MREIILKKLVLDNFQCFQHKEVTFNGKRSIVRGRNGIGKTTLLNAVMWALFDKDMQGNTAKNVRPHDKDGKDIDMIDISVSATFEVDGREITLTKVQSQQWVKDRATQKQTFKGNENTFTVNDIPKKSKDYKQYIEENFCAEDVFLSCTNAMSFFKLDTKKRRAKLMSLAKNFSNEDVIAADERFEPLADMLKDGTIEELVARSKSAIKKLNEKLDSIPNRIDEQNRSKVDIDVAELELQKNGISEKIDEIDKQISEVKSSGIDNAKEEALNIKFEINDLQRKANEELFKKRMDIEDSTLRAMRELDEMRSNEIHLQRDIEDTQITLREKQDEELYLKNDLTEIQQRRFDEKSLVCIYCGQEYPAEKKTEIKANFEKERMSQISDNADARKGLQEEVKTLTKVLEQLQVELSDVEKKLPILKAQKDAMKKQLDEFPTSKDISNDADYIKLSSKLKELEEIISNGNNEEQLSALDKEKQFLIADLHCVESEILRSQRNVDIDERITELKAEQRQTSQLIANEEKTLALLEDFNRARMNMLTESINEHFSLVKWVIFQEQINGGYADVCYATVNGSNREKGLNDSDCLLADLDILQTFQKMNDLNIVLFLDRAESINADRIPSTDCQLILLAVSDNEEMVVK